MGHILFLGVYIKLYIGDSLFVVFSCTRTHCRGLGTYSCLYIHYCNFILFNIRSDPPRRTLWVEMFLDRIDLSKTIDKHGTERCHVLSRSSRFLAAVLFDRQPVLVERGPVLTKNG